MSQQTYFRCKLQAAVDRLIEDSLKPFDPFTFQSLLQQNKEKSENPTNEKIPYELKSQETRETLYIIQNEMRRSLKEFINQQLKKSNIHQILDQFEQSFFQRTCMKNAAHQWDEREFLICVDGYDEEQFVNHLISEALYEQLK